MNLNEQLQQAYEAGRRQGLNESIRQAPSGYYYDPYRDQTIQEPWDGSLLGGQVVYSPEDGVGINWNWTWGGENTDITDYNDGVPPAGYDYWDGKMWRRATGGPLG